MVEWRGRALAYPAIVLAGWITGRTFALIGTAAPTVALPPARAPALSPARTVHQIRHADRERAQVYPGTGRAGATPKSAKLSPVAGHATPSHPQMATAVIRVEPLSPFGPERASPAPSFNMLSAEPFGPFRHRGGGHRFSAYGYMFWRPDGAGPGVAPAGQYGGSQAVIQLAYDLSGQTDKGLALHGRASFAPAGKQKELAIGLRWNRPARLPVTLIAERRLNPDSADRWAAFVAGGFDPKPLPLGFALDGYAQAGWAGGRDATGFFDAQARMVRPVLTLGETQIKAGAGVWAGGEDSAQRLDIGPAVAAAIPLGRARIELRLDWRQRIAGSAQPGSGPAVTVATGF